MIKKPSFSSRNTSALGRWLWTVDRWYVVGLILLIFLGVLLNFAATPSIAQKLNLPPFFFVKRHLIVLPFVLLIIFFLSLLPAQKIRRFSLLLYFMSLFFVILTLLWGIEIKGGKRWLNILGTSFQPSEFIKPSFSVMMAWVLAEKQKEATFPGTTLSLLFLAVPCCFLILQPDLGMTIILIFTWIVQIFIAGLPLLWIGLLGVISVLGLLLAYYFLPHVTNRIDQFFNPQAKTQIDLYQIQQSLQAFSKGGFFGSGPGEGVVKRNVPDAHADFIFAVGGEEFGMFFCFMLVLLFIFLVVKPILKIQGENSFFSLLAVSGLSAQTALQAFINMASTLHLIPTKGMTLPFVSYGGSSLIASGVTVGILLSLTRKRHGIIGEVL